MKQMIKKIAIIFAAALAAFHACAGSVSLSLETPKMNSSRKHSGASKSSKARNKKMTDETKRSYDYSGRISFSGGKDESMNVTLEAYFVTRGVGESSSPERPNGRTVVGVYEFGPGKPRSAEFTFSSPTYTQTTKTTVKTSKSRGRGRNRVGGSTKMDKTTTGERCTCVVLRAVSGGKVLKVVVEPSNSRWEEAARKIDFGR